MVLIEEDCNKPTDSRDEKSSEGHKRVYKSEERGIKTACKCNGEKLNNKRADCGGIRDPKMQSQVSVDPFFIFLTHKNTQT